MALTAREIDALEFASTFRGYNPDEVDVALDRIALAFHHLERELEELDEQQQTLLAERDELEQSLITLQQRAQQLERACDELRDAPQDDDQATVEQLRKALEDADEERVELRKEVARLRRASDAHWADARGPQPAVVTLPPQIDVRADAPPPPAASSHEAAQQPATPPPPPESSPDEREVSSPPRPPHAW